MTVIPSASDPWPGAAGWLRVALFGGLVAGLIAAAFNLLLAERVVDEAILLEAGGESVHSLAVEPFTRGEQRAGMVVGQVLLGAGVALILAGAALVLGPGAMPGPARRLWLALVGAGAWALLVLPAVKYPPLPPGIDAGLEIGTRQAAYLALAGCGVLGAFMCGALATMPAALPRPLRLAGCALLVVVPGVFAWLLLPDQGSASLPDGLLGRFRAVAIGSQAIFWLAFAVVGAWLLRTRGPSTAARLRARAEQPMEE